ncbi:hypothetical protein [Actinocatenispora sera]|uniref:Uncharacterized protein n=1 Tax=Actinocatenispora sera TaxID=390989 RepID=A0A810KUM7_9ACTN|nr:hypothetical protein [Actinocatenispora sera]BCJ26880.1 hypothetical protein Asera_09880 [Actinocatenispora sera]
MSRHDVASLACPALAGVRAAYCSTGTDADRVAALVEIAGAAAAAARTIYRYRHLDRTTLAELVSRPIDVAAVLGRGQWLPTMTFVPAPPKQRKPARRNAGTDRDSARAVQSSLFPVVPAFVNAGGGR